MAVYTFRVVILFVLNLIIIIINIILSFKTVINKHFITYIHEIILK